MYVAEGPPTRVPPTPGRGCSDAPDRDKGRTLIPPPRVSPMVVVPSCRLVSSWVAVSPGGQGRLSLLQAPPHGAASAQGWETKGQANSTAARPRSGCRLHTPQLASGFRLSWLRTPAVLQQIYRRSVPECLPRAGDGAWRGQASVSSQ